MGRTAYALLALCALGSACSPGPGLRTGDADGARDAMRAVLVSTPGFVERGPRAAAAWAVARRFYAQREYRPAWLVGGRPTRRVGDLVHALLGAAEHGLDPDDYGAQEINEASASLGGSWVARPVDGAVAARLDAQITYAFLRLAADLTQGRVSPSEISPDYLHRRTRVDVAARLREALDSSGVAETLSSLAPSHAQYMGLQQALARYRATSPGGLGADEDHGWRIRQLEMNMERWRWAPRELGEQHVLVNVAGYELQVVEGYRPVLAMRVVVGERASPTPLFSDVMTYVVFSPYWNIPESILRQETLAQIAEDPGFMARAGIEAVRVSGDAVERIDAAAIDWSVDLAEQGVRFRQAPGPENALGRVKFIFPNHFSVYLHDTPNTAVFDRARRAYSHGCVRVEDPVGLAQQVLREEPGWTRDRIVAAMDAREETVVRLEHPIPVHLGYWTAWVQQDGTVAFTDDPYGLDRRHDEALRRARRRATPPTRRPDRVARR